MKKEDDRVVQKSINLFLVLFLLTGSLLGGMAAVLYHSAMDDFMSGLKVRETRAVELELAAIQTELSSVANDVLFLAGQNELIRFLDTGDERLLKEIQDEYLHLADVNKTYDQVRFLNEAGMEMVRVNFESGSPVPIPEDRLRDKRKRYYFTDCFALEKNGIFASPMDLNMEDGGVEFPLKPMIRIGTPLFDSKGNKKGIVLINYRASNLLDRIVRSGTTSWGDAMLLNHNGYWLLGPSSDREWGFMFRGRAGDTFARDFPEEWRKVLETSAGQFSTGNGLFSFVTVHPLRGSLQYHGFDQAEGAASHPIDTSQYFWVLLSRVPPQVRQAHAKDLLFKLFLGGGGLFLFIGFGAWHLAVAITRHRTYQAKLVTWAMYDPLTGLPNRKLFFDNLAAGLSLAQRFERRLALLYIDLDGFKAVNDTHGHEAGDTLLIQVGHRLTNLLRKSDTVARLGGDEFAVILTEIATIEAAASVGRKVIEELNRPFMLAKGGAATIGASVGVAVYPDHEQSEDALIHSADRAMYESKSKGKNACTTARSEHC